MNDELDLDDLCQVWVDRIAELPKESGIRISSIKHFDVWDGTDDEPVERVTFICDGNDTEYIITPAWMKKTLKQNIMYGQRIFRYEPLLIAMINNEDNVTDENLVQFILGEV